MGYLSKAVKKSVEKLKKKIKKYSKRSDNSSCSELEGPIYEEVTFLECKADSCSDSGISATSASKKKPKKIQFSSNIVHEFQSDPRESHSKLITQAQTCKAKYFETQPLQKVEIIPTAKEIILSFDKLKRDQVQMVTLPMSESSSGHSVDMEKYAKSPPKPMRSAYRMMLIREQQKRNSLKVDDDVSPNPMNLKPILRNRINIIPSSSEDETVEGIQDHKSQLKAIYATVTPRSSRLLTTPMIEGSSPEPASSSLTTPRSSKDNLLSTKSNSKDSLPTLPGSEEFLPEISSSSNNILDASIVKNKDIWSLNNFLSYKVCKKAKKKYSGKIETTVALVHEPNRSLDKAQPKSARKPRKELRQAFLRKENKLHKNVRDLESGRAQFLKQNKIESSGSSVDSDGLETLVTDHSSDFSFNNHKRNKKAPWKQPKKNVYRKQNELYKALRQTKDRVYKIMVEASNALQEANKRVKRNINQILVIQKVLLETGERVKLVNKHISDMSYAQINDGCPSTATITLSNIDIPLKPLVEKNYYGQYTERFLITVSHGQDLFVSQFIEEKTDLLSLGETFTFKNVHPDFEIKIQLFYIRLKNNQKNINWKRFLKPSKSKIIYQDHIDNQFLEKEVFQTSFQLCAEMTLTRDHIDTSSSTLIAYPKVFPRLSGKIQHYVQCNIDTKANLGGLLDVGTKKKDVLFWCTRYCMLNGNDLWIYADPNDWQFGRKPIEMINLSFCLGPIVKKINNCSRPRCFQLTTARPKNKSRKAALRSKPNFIQKRFYFCARTKSEYDEWTSQLDKLYQSLMLFKKLYLDQDYEEYYKGFMQN